MDGQTILEILLKTGKRHGVKGGDIFPGYDYDYQEWTVDS